MQEVEEDGSQGWGRGQETNRGRQDEDERIRWEASGVISEERRKINRRRRKNVSVHFHMKVFLISRLFVQFVETEPQRGLSNGNILQVKLEGQHPSCQGK